MALNSSVENGFSLSVISRRNGKRTGRWEDQLVSLTLRIGSAVVVKFAIYLRGFFLGHEWLKDILAHFCFLAGITHFLKLRSTKYGIQPSFTRVIRFFGVNIRRSTAKKWLGDRLGDSAFRQHEIARKLKISRPAAQRLVAAAVERTRQACKSAEANYVWIGPCHAYCETECKRNGYADCEIGYVTNIPGNFVPLNTKLTWRRGDLL